MSENSSPDAILNVGFTFRKRPIFLPEDLRPLWRIGLILLLMDACCRGGKTSRTRLHVLNWGVRSHESKQAILSVINGRASPSNLIVRFDPFLDKAIDYAAGEGLLNRIGGKSIQLSLLGKSFAKRIIENPNIYRTEKEFIGTIGNKITEELITKIFGEGE